MNVTVASMFRNAAGYIDRYADQIDQLRKLVDVRVVATWGDSTDSTGTMLDGRGWDVDECSHGGPPYGSIDHPARWNQIAKVARHTLDRVGDPGDALIWVEADLIWQAATLADLLEADRPVCPMILANGTSRFYDVYGYRQRGQWFVGQPPYLPFPEPERHVRVDSCGSCFVIPARDMDVVDGWSGHWPFPAGGRLWVDTESIVRHP